MNRASTSILSAALLLAFTGAARADDAEARAIIAKGLKAHGGDTYLDKNKAVQVHNKGKITLPGVGEVEFEQNNSIMLPDKFKESMELSVGGNKVTVVTIANGDKVSITANGTDVEITDAIKDALKGARHMIQVGRLSPLLKEKGFELSLIGESKVEGKATVGVLVSKKGQKDVSLFFDKETNLLAKIEHRTPDPTTGNEITEERIILEYKKNADGIQVPKRVAVKHDGKAYIEVEVLEMKFLEKIDDSEFKK
jgi:hypothetical protein